jgi:NADH-quinone oxidoreductase subunit J
LILFGGLSAAVIGWDRMQIGPGLPPGDTLLTEFGMALVNPIQYAIPFEIASVLLLAALVGAIFVADERKGGKE